MAKVLSILQHFVVLNPDKKASLECADAGLYQRLEQNYQEFAGHELISCHEFAEDWRSWEMHPAGDEIVILLSGAVQFIWLGDEREDETQHLRELSEAGQFLVIPKGHWHTAKTKLHSRVLFITPGQGTQHKAL